MRNSILAMISLCAAVGATAASAHPNPHPQPVPLPTVSGHQHVTKADLEDTLGKQSNMRDWATSILSFRAQGGGKPFVEEPRNERHCQRGRWGSDQVREPHWACSETALNDFCGSRVGMTGPLNGIIEGKVPAGPTKIWHYVPMGNQIVCAYHPPRN
jgi:hypothetical protein